jgi:hypothetical protein
MASDLVALEDRLWATADQLWANTGLKPSEFSTPVLGLIFLRYADRRFPFAAWDGSLARMPILQPADDLLWQFEAAVAPMLAWVKGALARQNNLRETRDLQPKLISGELDVSA